MTHGAPTDLTGDDLLAAARAVRDRHHGSRVTFSPKVFIPLTMLCRDRCGYCTFARPPARLDAPYMEPDQVLEIAPQWADDAAKDEHLSWALEMRSLRLGNEGPENDGQLD